MRVLVIVASLVVILAGLRAAAPIIIPFLLALFLAMLSLPLLRWLQARRVPMAAGVLATVAANVVGLLALLAVVAGSVRAFTEAAPRYQERLHALTEALGRWLEGYGLDRSRWLLVDLSPGTALDLVQGLVSGLAAALSNTVLVFLTIAFILLEAAGLPPKIAAAFPHGRGALVQLERITREVQRYLLLKTVVSLATGILIGAALALLGVDFPVLWGLVAFVLNYVPNVGSILAAVPAVLLALVQLGPGSAAATTAVYLAVNMALGNMVEPWLQGRTFGLSTLVVFLSLVFWGWLWGPVGMLLSVPLTMVVQISFAASPELAWVAVLLGPSPGGPRPPRQTRADPPR